MKKLMKGKRFGVADFLMLTLAGIINSVGVTMFLAPVKLFDSGLSGTSMLLWQITPEYLTLSMFLLVLNLPFFILGFKKQGLVFTVYSLYAIAVYSLCSFLIEYVIPIDVATSSPFAGKDLLLCAAFGGLISGVGSGLTIRGGGAIDGVEVMAVIFARRIGITVGTFVMIYNALLYIAAGIVFGSFIIPLYSVIAYAVGLKSVDFIVEGLDKAKAAVIITRKTDEVAGELSDAFSRGVTLINAKGYYSREDSTFIYCVVNRFQIARLKKIVAEADPAAFVTITEISDTLGSSLKLERKQKKKSVPKGARGESEADSESASGIPNYVSCGGLNAEEAKTSLSADSDADATVLETAREKETDERQIMP